MISREFLRFSEVEREDTKKEVKSEEGGKVASLNHSPPSSMAGGKRGSYK